MPGTRYSIEVRPKIPEKLARLVDLSNDLLYGWDRPVRGLFYRLDKELWESCGHNPTLFLRRISQTRLEEVCDDRVYMEDYNRVVSTYDNYLEEGMRSGIEELLDPEHDLIAYFCAEFGFHESLSIYSGGLGILAGDHCKAASDLGIPFVAVGMLYRQGYFVQTIDGHGKQIAHYAPKNFEDLPITPAVGSDGNELRVSVKIAASTVTLRIWEVNAGHIKLYLLDSDLPENDDTGRAITYQLYGGDATTRISQEIVLGIGGVRALRALGLSPSVWHINEGHASFQIVERIREYITEDGLDFSSALELAASATVFTTHTPVPAGHDIFNHDLMHTYLGPYLKDTGIELDTLLGLGASPINDQGFNQTSLGLRGSRHHNGVSRIHGTVASQMESYIWSQIPHEENPMGYVTNGVHVPTFLAREWANLYDMRFGREWRNELLNDEYWERIDEIPDHSYWSLRQSLKAELLADVRHRTVLQHRRNGCSDAQIDRITRYLSPYETDILTIGFARRFATYKRATLLFSDPERLARIINDPDRPVLIVFAGKAHPNDLPGQHLIQVIHDFSRRPEFIGKIILIEGYDMSLGRKLVTGVDVWLNNPEYPMEASGTSGQKAGSNGVINLSVLDGWWGEGYNGENGWAIAPHGPSYDAAYRNQEEANELLDILEHQVIPLYYDRNGHGYSEGWVSMSKASMKSTLPQFNSQRMVMDYIQHYYSSASKQCRLLSEAQAKGAKELAAWKKKIGDAWNNVSLRRIDTAPDHIIAGKQFSVEVTAMLNGLSPKDVVVECVIGTETEHGDFIPHSNFPFQAVSTQSSKETHFKLEMEPPLPGLQYYRIRMFPYHTLLTHPFELGFMVWL